MAPLFLDDATIARLLDFSSVQAVLDEALTDLANGQASIHPRQRSACGSTRFSSMGAVWPRHQVAGAKLYPTVNGQFSFLLTLFDTAANRPLAVMEANELTRFRTAAMTALVAGKAARPAPRKLALFGAGVQGRSLVDALCGQFQFDQVAVVDPQGDDHWCARTALRVGSTVGLCDAESAVRGADIVVTATRSKTPVFDGTWLKPGAFVSAVGTSNPDGRELDDHTLARAARCIVEWAPQSLAEAGEVVLGQASGALDAARIVDLPALYRGAAPWRHSEDEIVVFKTVGVGLADVACAWLALQRATAGTAA